MQKITGANLSPTHSVIHTGMAMIFLAFLFGACAESNRSSDANPAAAPNTLTEEEQNGGWRLLFDGETFSGWRGLNRESVPAGHWVIEDGAIRKVASADVPSGTDGGDILFDEPFGNFELSFEWKVSPGANSGIKYNVSEAMSSGHGALGFEYQILDNDRHPDAGNDPNRLAAGLYDLIPPGSNARLNPVGTWNSGRIVFNGSRGEHWLNGNLVLEYELGTYMMNRLLETSKWGDNPDFGVRRDTGRIVFQDHSDEVWYRSIKIRELTP
ncbi:MAG: DUF1080 domain-containing protein [Balneolales bacterium]